MADSVLVLVLTIAATCGAIFVVGEILIRIVNRVADHAGASKGLQREVREILSLVMLILIIFAAARLADYTSEVTTLTVSGIVGLAVSLALQSTLSNIISGILLLHDKVLKLGDDILYSGVRGKVIRIGLRNTWIQTADNAIVMISNTSMSGGPLTNFTAATRIRDDIERGR